MLINLFGFVFIIVITVFAFKTAKEYGRNAIGWALISLIGGICIQMMLPIFIVIIIAIIATAGGSSPQKIQDNIPIVTITIACIVLSLAAGFFLLRHLVTMPEEESFDIPPAPPSDFS